jgi:hypothetical protein
LAAGAAPFLEAFVTFFIFIFEVVTVALGLSCGSAALLVSACRRPVKCLHFNLETPTLVAPDIVSYCSSCCTA